MIYHRYLELELDGSEYGFMQSDDSTTYFCTPLGAKIIGWTGVDGIHFCFIEGYGETIFAISPMNFAGDYVHPVASSFSDFLSLILSSKDTAAIEQAWQWDQVTFDSYVAEIQESARRTVQFQCIQESLEIEQMPNAYRYIHELQNEFDYSRIEFTDEYRSIVGE